MADKKTRSPEFWKRIPLDEMNRDQWEALCDGCAKCCLFKIEDEDTSQIWYTRVACRLLDLKTCRCSRYADRSRLVKDCITLTPDKLSHPYWLPTTCAYRRLAEGKNLPAWHPLKSGDPETVKTSGNSVFGRVVTETEADDLETHLIDWVRSFVV